MGFSCQRPRAGVTACRSLCQLDKRMALHVFHDAFHTLKVLCLLRALLKTPYIRHSGFLIPPAFWVLWVTRQLIRHFGACCIPRVELPSVLAARPSMPSSAMPSYRLACAGNMAVARCMWEGGSLQADAVYCNAERPCHGQHCRFFTRFARFHLG